MHDPHPSSADLAQLSVSDLVERMARGELTSVQIVDGLLGRVRAVDAATSGLALNAVAAIDAGARAVAAERDDERRRGVSRGPLHGVPVMVKDNIEARGLPGAAGSSALAGRPARDAALVTRLRASGAVVLASTNLSEWANIRSPRSTSGYSATGGLVANPWALDRSAGGSSSGSGAALAAGLTPLAVGTETDGSIVCPSSLNGVVGLKPTVGAAPTAGVVPISASQDSPGPMGRRVEDVARLFGVLAASEPPPVLTAPSFAVAANWRTGHPATDRLFDELVHELRADGHRALVRDVAVPGEPEGRDELTVLLCELLDDLSAYLAARPGDGVRSLADVVAYEDEHRDLEQRFFGHEHFESALASGGRAGPDYADARRRNLTWAVETCLEPGLEGVDVLLAPTFAPAWKVDLTLGDHGIESPATTAPAIAGWPILCLPMGLVHDLPVGVAVLGRPGSEWALLEAARVIERVVGAAMSTPSWRSPARG
jgi:amidase